MAYRCNRHDPGCLIINPGRYVIHGAILGNKPARVRDESNGLARGISAVRSVCRETDKEATRGDANKSHVQRCRDTHRGHTAELLREAGYLVPCQSQ